MQAKIKDMTTGRPLPLMIGNIFQQLYTVVDTMVVGKALGVDALAVLGATDWHFHCRSVRMAGTDLILVPSYFIMLKRISRK